MELKGFEEQSGATREAGIQHGAIQDRVTWTDRRQADADGTRHHAASPSC